MRRSALATVACLAVAACTAVGPRHRLERIGEYTGGQFLPVEPGDFPDGRVELASPSVGGSRALTEAYWADEGVQTFVRTHGLPDAVAIDPRGVVVLAYGEKGILYEFDGRLLPSAQRQLSEEELDQVLPERRRARQAEHLRELVDQQARVLRIGRRLIKSLPASAAAPAGEYYGFFTVPVAPASAHLYGHAAGAEGRIVAWVDGEGPAADALLVGDRITAIDGVQISVREQAGMRMSGPITLAVVRQDAPLRIRLAPESWPRQVTFFIIPADEPNAVAVEGAVAVTTGMIELVPDDDGLAFAIGHELAHISEGHVERRVTAGSILTGVVRLGVLLPVAIAVPGSGQYLDAAMQGVENRFNRDQERDADRLGVRYARTSGYDPHAAVAFMTLIERTAPVDDVDQFFDIHPPYPERRQILESELGRVTE
jgi:Zn-dependent protease with chaperone function